MTIAIQRGLIWDVVVTEISRVEMLPVISDLSVLVTSRSQGNNITYYVELTSGDPYDVDSLWTIVSFGTLVPLGYKSNTITFDTLLVLKDKVFIRVRLSERDSDGVLVEFQQELFVNDAPAPEPTACSTYTCEMNCQSSCESSCEIACELADQGGSSISSAVYLSDVPPTIEWDSSDTAGVGRSFGVGDEVQIIDTGVVYRCADATPGAAVWNIILQERG